MITSNEEMSSFLMTTLEVMAALFLFAVGCLVLWAIVAFVVDISHP